MYESILYQILLAVLIVGGVFLVMVLFRLYQVLTDIKDATTIISRRVEQIDGLIDSAGNKLKGLCGMASEFVSSIVGGKKVKEVFEDFWSKKSNSKEE